MDRTFRIAIVVLLALNLVWAATFISRSLSAGPGTGREAQAAGTLKFETADKFTLYVGLNDKDTHTRLVSLEEAKERLNAVAMRHVDGFTVRQAQGFWKDEKGVPTNEDSLVYDFVDATEEQVVAIMKEMLTAMNQNSILIEKAGTRRLFYP